jgi:hypothetical protein
LVQQVTVLDTPVPVTPAIRFGATIGLIESRIEHLDGRRFRVTFDWVASAQPAGDFVAVSRLDGVDDARIVHLPTYVLLPTSQWQPGQVVRETFDVELPREIAPGSYPWRIGWYDLRHSEAYATDERSRLPGSAEVVLTTIEVP